MALDMSGVEVMSLLDLKDAYHSLRLSLNSKKYCEIHHIFVQLPISIKD